MRMYDFVCRPKMTWLNVNNECNFRCKWCYTEAAGFDSKKTMSLELAKDLIDISKLAGVEHINFIGGEPTLWEHLFELTDYCKILGMTTGLITNCALFGNDSYWKEYKLHKNDRISISVKSMSDEEFKSATNSDLYEQTLIGIKRGLELFKTGITTVYNSYIGISGLKRIAKFSHELGASSIIVNMCSPVIGKNSVNSEYTIELEELASNTIEIASYLESIYGDSYELDIQMPLCLFPDEFVDSMLEKGKIQTICQLFSRGGLNFNYRGDVIPCNEMFDTVVVRRGKDYTDYVSLMEFLNSEKIKEQYKSLLRYPSEECSKCKRQIDCRGGCLLNWLIYDSAICHHK